MVSTSHNIVRGKSKFPFFNDQKILVGCDLNRIWISRKIVACKNLTQFSIEHEMIDGREGIYFIWSTKGTSFMG